MRNIFRLFCSTSREGSSEGIITIPKVKIPTSLQILLLTEKYIQENSSKLELPIPSKDYSRLLEEHSRLTKIGLGNTKNARIIQQSIFDIESEIHSKQKAEDLIKFIKELRRHFGENTVLISRKQFEILLRDYNLVVGTIGQYTGTIPDKNIKEIESATNKVKYFRYKLNSSDRSEFLWKLDEIKFSGPSQKLKPYLVPWLEKKRGLVYSNESYFNYKNGLYLYEIKYCNSDLPEIIKNYKDDDLIFFKGRLVDSDTMLIACPSDQLEEQSIKITQKEVDPIVFQYSPYGVVIYSIWGNEAEDKVFEEYKKINNLLSI